MRDLRAVAQHRRGPVCPQRLQPGGIGYAGPPSRPGYDIAAMEARAHATLDAAWAAGVRYFDAARSYGRAEEFLGHWLAARKIPPGTVTVGSRWGYVYTAGWRVVAEKHEVKDHSLAVLRRQYAESRALLAGHLSLYQIHSATLDSGVLDNQGVLDELLKEKSRLSKARATEAEAELLRARAKANEAEAARQKVERESDQHKRRLENTLAAMKDRLAGAERKRQQAEEELASLQARAKGTPPSALLARAEAVKPTRPTESVQADPPPRCYYRGVTVNGGEFVPGAR
jgi:aryl-alcohol dehydrogenase-like predicted oxidoreductase